MKEKVIFTLSLACFIGIMWLSSTAQTTYAKLVISEEVASTPQESNAMDYIVDVSSETIHVDAGINSSDISICSLKPIETDVFTFGEAFQYYRKCRGSDSSFHWKGSIYTTILSEEIIIQVADSVHVRKKTNNNQVSEIQ